MSWAEATLALYYATLGVLAAFGLHRLALVATLLRRRRPVGSETPPGTWPVVTVQLPIYNELYVAERLVRSVGELAYPADRLEIQVLDDSTDATTERVASVVAELRERGIDAVHLHRADRRGYKAGALAAGLAVARGELVAVFDADFVPPADFLARVVPTFADPEVGMVQARWGHLNRDGSLLTRVQAILLDAHFVVEHAARHLAGCFFNFNGTAGVWRRRAIEEAGGWEHDTLTEDLDLSYRAQLAGWKFVYRGDVEVPAELPAEIRAYKSQQRRWTEGSAQTARKLLGRVLRAKLPWRTRAEAFVHLSGHATYPLMVALSLLVFPAMALRRGVGVWALLAIDLPLFLAATGSVLVYFTVSQRELGGDWRRRLWQLPALMGVGIGLAVNNTRAALAGLVRKGGVFQRTPKVADGAASDDGYRLPVDPALPLEALFALYFAATLPLAFHLEMWLSVPFLLLFLHGYTSMTVLGLRAIWAERTVAAARAAAP